MSEPSASKSELPIIPALVVSSLLGAVIALGAVGLWNWTRPEPPRPGVVNAPAMTVPPSSVPATFQEFTPPLTPDEERIEKALEQRVDLEFADTPLTDVVIYLKDYCGVEIIIDRETLQAEGIAPDTLITYQAKGQRLRAALELLLEPLQLDAVPRANVLVITTRSRLREHHFTRVYPVSDLCRIPESGKYDYQPLMTLIENTTSGPWLGGSSAGTMSDLPISGSLLVHHDYRVHREILDLLRSMRQAQKSNLALADKQTLQAWDEARVRNAASLLKAPPEAAKVLEVIDNETSDRERQIETALDKTVSWSFSDTPLTEVGKSITESLGIPVHFDYERLLKNAFIPEQTITANIPATRAETALKVLLGPLKLAHAIDQEMLLITAPERAKRYTITRTYPVSDLVANSDELQALVKRIEKSTRGPWFQSNGEGGVIYEFPGTGNVIVRQSREAHREVLEFLRQQRRALAQSKLPRTFDTLHPPPPKVGPGSGLGGTAQPGGGLFHVSSPSTITAPAENDSDLKPRKRTNVLD